MRECNKNIVDALELAKQMIILSDKGSESSDDDSCILLYGVIRDAAYRIKQLAEGEKEKHNEAGRWD